MKIRTTLFIFLLLSAIACGKNNSNNTSENITNIEDNPNRVDWQSVPSEFNPNIETFAIESKNLEKVYLDFFGFRNDVVVIEDDQTDEFISFKIYQVHKGTYSLGSLDIESKENVLEIQKTGSYSCSIQIQNRRITSLNGGCFVRIEIIVPKNSRLEIYNLNELISKRYFAMKNNELLKKIDYATGIDSKMAVIDSYLKSHQQSGATPDLSTKELHFILQEFAFAQDRFRVLRTLHSFTRDRERLPNLIEQNFSFFDRQEAKNIVGI